MEHERHVISILAVEDDKATREIIRVLIDRKFPGIPLYFAENGRRGVELFTAYTPEIVITDIIMPEMDGVEMAVTIRSLRPDTMFIVVSGYSAPSYHEQFSNIGSKAFLMKPINFRELLTAIESCFAEIRINLH